MAKKATIDPKITLLKGACPPECHEAVDQLVGAGFNPLMILTLIMQYGPQLAAIVQQIIDALRQPTESTGTKAGQAVGCCFDECDPEYVEQYEHLVHAMCLCCCLAHKSCTPEE